MSMYVPVQIHAPQSISLEEHQFYQYFPGSNFGLLILPIVHLFSISFMSTHYYFFLIFIVQLKIFLLIFTFILNSWII